MALRQFPPYSDDLIRGGNKDSMLSRTREGKTYNWA